MNMLIDIVMWICIGGVILFFLFLTWALCVMASRNDYISDEDWEEFLRKEGYKDGCEKISEAASQNRQDDCK